MGATYAQRRALGDFGERVAARELTQRGLSVLDRNWRCGQGEIDIVAADGRTLVVCEVKTRRSNRFGAPLEAITEAKAHRLHRLGLAWAAAHGSGWGEVRVDVVAVLVERHSAPVISHFRGVV